MTQRYLDSLVLDYSGIFDELPNGLPVKLISNGSAGVSYSDSVLILAALF